MAFPGTYNFNYYKGDTFEFRVYPKDASGATFPLSQFLTTEGGTTKFTLAPSRGSSEGLIEGYAEISNDQTNILCAITPANGAVMTAGTTYVYDVEIAKTRTPYDSVYTLLTGNITVTEQVTPPSSSEPEEVVSIPNNPTDFSLLGVTTNSISFGWTAPATGDDPTGYKIYILPYTINPADLLVKLTAGPDATVAAGTTTYTATGLTSSTQYLIGIRSFNGAGDALAFSAEGAVLILSNLGVPITTLPEAS